MKGIICLCRSILLLSVFHLFSNELFCQDLYYNRIETTFSFGKQDLINKKARTNDCDACTVFYARGRLAFNTEVSYYHLADHYNEITTGIGLNVASYYSKGYRNEANYQVDNPDYTSKYSMLNVFMKLGHRIIILPFGKFKPFITYELIMDITEPTLDIFYIKTVNFSYRLNPGILIKLDRRIDFKAGLYYKGAIFRYNKQDEEIRNLPFSYGIETGFSFKFI